MKLGFSRKIFEKYSKIKSDKNPSIADGRKGMLKLIVAFCNFVNVRTKKSIVKKSK